MKKRDACNIIFKITRKGPVTAAMRFEKMHGAGNDFIIIDAAAEGIAAAELPRIAQKLCARRTSIGADGLMAIVPAEKGGDFGMLFYNSDGSLGEMCGNGARCICRYGYEHGLAGERQRVETTAGLVTGERVSRRRYRVRLNDPSVAELCRTAEAQGREYDCAYFELGSPGLPHAVLLMPDWERRPLPELRELGRALCHSPAFPKGANVSFVAVTGEDRLSVVTFERGVEDFTLACGTGCGSTVAALTLTGLVSGRDVRIRTPGGELEISLTARDGAVRDIYLTGPTNTVAQGEVLDEDL